MSNVAELIRENPSRSHEPMYLGPATVTRPGVREIEVRLDTGERVPAVLALALPYAAMEGDVVLALGRREQHYVVGVLHGSGQTSLSFRGDVELEAVGGSLRLRADQDVEVSGRNLRLQATDLKIVAQSLVEHVRSAYQRVRGLLSVHAERTHTVVDETSFSRARAATILTEENVTINGEQIHIG